MEHIIAKVRVVKTGERLRLIVKANDYREAIYTLNGYFDVKISIDLNYLTKEEIKNNRLKIITEMDGLLGRKRRRENWMNPDAQKQWDESCRQIREHMKYNPYDTEEAYTEREYQKYKCGGI